MSHISEDHKRKISASRQGKPLSAEHRRKLSEARRRRAPISAETRAKIGAALRGRKRDPNIGLRISATLKGRPVPLERRERIAATLRGRRLSPQHRAKLKGKPSWNKGMPVPADVKLKLSLANIGKKHSLETRLKMSIAQSGLRVGAKNPFWTGGNGRDPHGPGFTLFLKGKILERDGHRCQMPQCGIPENGKSHSVHHIDYDKNNHDPSNLITLCTNCHSKTNHKNRAAWQRLLSESQSTRGFHAEAKTAQ